MNGQSGIVRFVFGGQGPLGHHTESVGRTNLDNPLGLVLAQDDILGFNPSHRRGELICQELDEEGMGELLLDFGTHDGGDLTSEDDCGCCGYLYVASNDLMYLLFSDKR